MSKERVCYGKQWLEFLGFELGMNAIEFNAEIRRTNTECDGTELHINPGTIRGQFVHERQPRDEFQSLVKFTVQRVMSDNGRGTWRDDVHSYPAFCSGRAAIKAPMQICGCKEEAALAAYAGSYIMFRRMYDDRVAADYVYIRPSMGAGMHAVDWWLKEQVGQEDVYLLHRGHGYLADGQLCVVVGQMLDDVAVDLVKMNISRNANDDPARLVAIADGCCSIDRAPAGKRTYLTRIGATLMKEEDWKRIAVQLEADILENGPGDMIFPELHAPKGSIRDIPDRLIRIARGLPPIPTEAKANPAQSPPSTQRTRKGKRSA